MLNPKDLKTVIYDYQLNQIVENDDTIVQIAIHAAIEEVKSYLNTRYDTDKIFTSNPKSTKSTKSPRYPLIKEITKDIALWQIIRLANPDIIHERVKERYDRAIEWLDKAARGAIAPELPRTTEKNNTQSINYGSITKQTYDY